MINWLYLHLRAIGHALGRLAGQPLGTLLSALVVGIALSLPGGGYLLLDNVSSLVRVWWAVQMAFRFGVSIALRNNAVPTVKVLPTSRSQMV